MKIDHYMTLTMDAVGILNDLAGGVTLEVLDDMTELDPERYPWEQSWVDVLLK